MGLAPGEDGCRWNVIGGPPSLIPPSLAIRAAMPCRLAASASPAASIDFSGSWVTTTLGSVLGLVLRQERVRQDLP